MIGKCVSRLEVAPMLVGAGPFLYEIIYVGEPIEVVIAESRQQAEDALDSIEIEYEPLQAVVDCVAAVLPGSPTAHRGAPHNVVAELDLTFGHVDEAFA